MSIYQLIFLYVEVWGKLSSVPHLGSSKQKIKVSARLDTSLEVLGKKQYPSSFRCWQNSVPYNWRILALASLPPVSWKLLSLPELTIRSLPLTPFVSKPDTSPWISLLLWLPFLSPAAKLSAFKGLVWFYFPHPYNAAESWEFLWAGSECHTEIAFSTTAFWKRQNSREREWAFLGAQWQKTLPANPGDSGHVCLIPGSGRSPGGGNGNPLQRSCLENPMEEEPGWLQATESDTPEHLSSKYTWGNRTGLPRVRCKEKH